MVGRGLIPLRLYPASPRPGARERAARVIEALESHRRVSAGEEGWWVRYEATGVSEAMAMCAADLDDSGPGWMEILDFEALASFARPGAGRRMG